MSLSVSDTRRIDRSAAESWVRQLKSDLSGFRIVFGDKERPVEERWQIYILIQPFLETDGLYQDFNVLGDVSWYDDFHLEKGETQKLDNDFITEATTKFKLSLDQQNELKEEILAYASKEGYGSFENDW